MTQKKPKLPIILYEEPKPNEPANPIPYVEVGLDDEMPKILFISEYKETGEFEPTAEGSAAIIDMYIHKYVDLEHLKEVLDPKTNDKVRVALGMKPLLAAQKKGQKIMNKVMKNAEKNRQELQTNQDKRQQRAFNLGQDFIKKAEQFLKSNKGEE